MGVRGATTTLSVRALRLLPVLSGSRDSQSTGFMLWRERVAVSDRRLSDFGPLHRVAL
jgi:hypothetical protein